MAKKAPRRTAERILEVSLNLFNRFGEPNVSTTLISAELGISPGNLYYHYPAKDELINALFDRLEAGLNPLLHASDGVRDVEDAWFFVHTLFEQVWAYRFIYRDLNDLLSKNRHLEARVQVLLRQKARSLRTMLQGLQRSAQASMDAREIETTAQSMVVVLTYWLSFEYAQDPRRALEPEQAQAAWVRGAQHVLGLMVPYMPAQQRQHLLHLAGSYGGSAAVAAPSHP